MQIVLWVVIPYLLHRGLTDEVMTVLLFMFLFQYLPKIYHSVCLLRRMQKFSGYVFGTVWWGFALNIIVYFVASHVSPLSQTNLGHSILAVTILSQDSNICQRIHKSATVVLTCQLLSCLRLEAHILVYIWTFYLRHFILQIFSIYQHQI